MAANSTSAVPFRQPWIVWQLADSAFPTGGFAHSWGLEAAWQSGEVPDRSALARFVHGAVGQAGRSALPFLTAAWRRPERFAELDALSDAFITSSVANRASRVQGRAFLATCVRIWPVDALLDLDRAAQPAPTHCAPIVGAASAALQAPLDVAQRLFLFNTVRGVLAAAVRLGIVGSYDAQRLQYDCAPALERTLDRCRDLDERDAAQTAPILDLLQSAHDRLYSRLFQS
jgi:urease accessory protein